MLSFVFFLFSFFWAGGADLFESASLRVYVYSAAHTRYIHDMATLLGRSITCKRL